MQEARNSWAKTTKTHRGAKEDDEFNAPEEVEDMWESLKYRDYHGQAQSVKIPTAYKTGFFS